MSSGISAESKQRLAERWAASAATYAELALQLETYTLTNRLLADRMGLEPGMEIVDLACGTGATSRAAFRAQPRLSHVWAVDDVAEMLEEARKLLHGLPVTFVCRRAEDFSAAISARRIARVLCNSAFFQFSDSLAALAEVRAVLHPAGRLGLTVPGPTSDSKFAEIRKRVVEGATWREEERETRSAARRAGPLKSEARGPRCDYRTIYEILKAGRFEILSSEFMAFRPSAEDLERWLLLPVFRPVEWSEWDDESLARALHDVLAQIGSLPMISWNLIVARPQV